MAANSDKLTSKQPNTIISGQRLDYELIDCGNHRKLERFGTVITNRPEIEAKWQTTLPKHEWDRAHWYFFEESGKRGRWEKLNSAAKQWKINYKSSFELSFKLEHTAFKHIGIFPEQSDNWMYLENQISPISKPVKVLNLFAYTGIASIISAASGAEVTNVDSVKQVLNWGRENAALNRVDGIRWICEDARKFVKKSIRRGDIYQGIIMDPPAFGYGSKKEKWKLEKDLPHLLKDVLKLLDRERCFFILNTYSPKLNYKKLNRLLNEIEGFPKNYENNFLGLHTRSGKILRLGNLIRFAKL